MPWGAVRSNAASTICTRYDGAFVGGWVQKIWWSLHWGLRQGWAGGFQKEGGSTRQPQRTEPCQCVVGKPLAFHGALQGQMQPLQCAAGVVKPEFGAALGLVRWFVGVAVLPVYGDFQSRQHSATTTYRALPVCEWPALSVQWSTTRSNSASAVCSRCGGACTGAALGLGRWFVGVAVLPVYGDFQSRQHSATTTYRALILCEWPALSMPLGPTRLKAASAVCRSCGGLCTGSCGRAGQVLCGGRCFAGL